MDIVKFHPNERLGLPDFEQATGKLILLDNVRKVTSVDMPTGRATGQAATDARIMSGFLATVPTSTTIKIAAGAAYLSWLDRSTLRHGILHSGDAAPADYTLDFSLAAPGVYAIYLRFVYADTSLENRVFWNPAATPAAEEIDNVATRQAATWEVLYQSTGLSAPGSGEWVKIWEVTVVGGPVVSVTADFRHFYFEGSGHVSDNFAHEWGDGVHDRSGARSTYPIADWHLFGQYVRRQMNDIIDQNSAYGHVLKPDIDLEQLDDGHHGWSSLSAERGKHRDFYFGGDARFWWQRTAARTTPTRSRLEWTDQQQGAQSCLGVEVNSGATLIELLLEQNGQDADMAVGDVLQIRGGGTSLGQFRMDHEIQASDRMTTTIWGSGNREFEFKSGAGQSEPGLHSRNGIWTGEDKTCSIWVPARIASNFTTTSDGWRCNVDNTPENDIAALYVGTASEGNMHRIDWLPEGAIVNWIDFYWRQSAGPLCLRGYAQRFRMTRTALGYDTIESFTPYDLHTSQQYTEYGNGGSAAPFDKWALDRFTCNESLANRTFKRSLGDELVITTVSTEAVNNYLHGYWINFTYRWAQQFPIA